MADTSGGTEAAVIGDAAPQARVDLVSLTFKRSFQAMRKLIKPVLAVTTLFFVGDIIATLLAIPGDLALAYVGVGISVLFYGLGVGILSIVTVHRIENTSAGSASVISRALRRVVPIAAVLFLVSVAVSLGLVLLVIPGLIVMTALWVAVPAVASEDIGIIESMRRSLDLTKGHRMSFFALALGLIILSVAFTFVFVMAFAPLAAISELAIYPAMFVSEMFYAFMTLVVAVSYVTLREIKEGYGEERVAEIFG